MPNTSAYLAICLKIILGESISRICYDKNIVVKYYGQFRCALPLRQTQRSAFFTIFRDWKKKPLNLSATRFVVCGMAWPVMYFIKTLVYSRNCVLIIGFLTNEKRGKFGYLV